VSKGARWQTVALGWTAAVVVTMLIAWWAISIVGHQLTSTVALPKAATSDSSQRVIRPTVPRPRPSARLSHTAHGPSAAAVALSPTGATTGTSATGVPSAVGTTAGHGDGPDVGPRTSRPPATRPPPTSRPPSTVTDQRTVESDGGTAAFTCTAANKMSLLYATAADGYRTEPPRIRDASRIEVDFVGPSDQKIDARCRDGKVSASIED